MRPCHPYLPSSVEVVSKFPWLDRTRWPHMLRSDADPHGRTAALLPPARDAIQRSAPHSGAGATRPPGGPGDLPPGRIPGSRGTPDPAFLRASRRARRPGRPLARQARAGRTALPARFAAGQERRVRPVAHPRGGGIPRSLARPTARHHAPVRHAFEPPAAVRELRPIQLESGGGSLPAARALHPGRGRRRHRHLRRAPGPGSGVGLSWAGVAHREHARLRCPGVDGERRPCGSPAAWRGGRPGDRLHRHSGGVSGARPPGRRGAGRGAGGAGRAIRGGGRHSRADRRPRSARPRARFGLCLRIRAGRAPRGGVRISTSRRRAGHHPIPGDQHPAQALSVSPGGTADRGDPDPLPYPGARRCHGGAGVSFSGRRRERAGPRAHRPGLRGPSGGERGSPGPGAVRRGGLSRGAPGTARAGDARRRGAARGGLTMCGIAGYWNLRSGRPASRAVLEAMSRSLRHRGPDEEGYWVEGALALGMTRLRVVDPAGGHQPMANEDGTVQVVYNGEIYNHADLRRELEARGHRFRTRSDTEAIVHAFEEWGPACVERFNGMFAFAAWDARERQLFLARDRLGIKPLYVYDGPEGVAFGSELKAVITHPAVPVKWDLEAVDDFLTYEFVPAPRSIVRDVTKVPPGTWMLWREDGGRVETRRFWRPHAGDRPATVDEAARGLRERLQASVRRRLMADVPLGAFLSGGIDSSIIVGLMSAETPGRVRSFSLGFEDRSYNELPYAALVAERFGATHRAELVLPRIVEMAERLAGYFDEPLGDVSAFSHIHDFGAGAARRDCGALGRRRRRAVRRLRSLPRRPLGRSHPVALAVRAVAAGGTPAGRASALPPEEGARQQGEAIRGGTAAAGGSRARPLVGVLGSGRAARAVRRGDGGSDEGPRLLRLLPAAPGRGARRRLRGAAGPVVRRRDGVPGGRYPGQARPHVHGGFPRGPGNRHGHAVE